MVRPFGKLRAGSWPASRVQAHHERSRRPFTPAKLFAEAQRSSCILAALISLRHITKRFGAALALDDVSLDIAPGERLGLIGENGAGKSSLMNVLYGLYHPDSGELQFDGQAARVRSPQDAIARGVGMVHQHFTLVPNLTVAENVVLGDEPTRFGLIDLDAAVRTVEETCKRLGFTLDARARVDRLTVGSQQKVEIVKA